MNIRQNTKVFIHSRIRTLEIELQSTPGAEWMEDWIDCLSYLCGCEECQKRMKKNTLDTNMMDRIFRQ